MLYQPFVSVIIPTYNDQARLRMAVESVIEQTYPQKKYEIIVVDNNSKDNTPEIIKKYPGVIYLEENFVQSAYAARNKGIGKAKGELLFFLDSKCRAKHDWIEKGVSYFRDSEAGIAGGKIIFVFRSGQPNIYEYIDSLLFLNQEDYARRGYSAGGNMIIRKEVIKLYGEFDGSLYSGGDYEIGRRIIGTPYKIVFAKDAVASYPAKDSFSELWKKAIRTGRGHKQLRKRKAMAQTHDLRYYLPKIKFIFRDNGFGPVDNFRIFVLLNIIKYANLISRYV